MTEETTLLTEIDDALRADKLEQIWQRHGALIIGFCVLAVLATAAGTFWKNHLLEEHMRDTGILAQGTTLAQDGKYGEAITLFEKIELEGGSLGAVAGLKHAEALANLKQDDKAAALYRTIAASGDAPISLRDYARLQGDILAHNAASAAGKPAPAQDPAAAKNTTFSQSTREAQALWALKSGDTKTAKELLNAILADDMASMTARTRASDILQTIGDNAK
jgi:hypothetical protein